MVTIPRRGPSGDLPICPPQVVSSLQPLASCGFVLVHSVLDAAGRLHALVEHVVEKETVPEWRPDGSEATFLNLLTWLTLQKGGRPGGRRNIKLFK